MLARWRETKRRRDVAVALFASVMDAARDPVLYVSHGASDTTDGRFEMLCAHLTILTTRLRRLPEDGEEMARAVNEAFVIAMDDTMRQVGIGDLSVPRKVKKTAAALYDRHRDYAGALAADPATALDAWRGALVAVKGQNGLTSIDPDGLAGHLARYADRLAAVSDTDLASGRI
jgi:cytochrome b pre-mRNA-processing protein 3